MRTLVANLILFALSTTARADDTTSILKAVALKYETATDYFAQVHLTAKVTKGVGVKSSFDFTIAASRPTQAMMWERSRSSYRYEVMIVANESSIFGYMPRRKRYTNGERINSEEDEELTRAHERFFRRFRMLDHLSVEITSAMDTIRAPEKNLRCLRVHLGSPDRGWNEDLWIDLESMLVVKSVARHKRSPPDVGEIVSTTVWSECRVNEELDPQLFTFKPPRGARRTNALLFR